MNSCVCHSPNYTLQGKAWEGLHWTEPQTRAGRPRKASGSEGIPRWVTVDLGQDEWPKAECSHRCPVAGSQRSDRAVWTVLSMGARAIKQEGMRLLGHFKKINKAVTGRADWR